MRAATAQIRGGQSQPVGKDAGDKGSDGEASIAPATVDADPGCPPAGVENIADGGQQRRVDHGRPRAQQQRTSRPGREAVGCGGEADRGGLGRSSNSPRNKKRHGEQ